MNIDLFLVSIVYWIFLIGLCMWLGRRLSKVSRRVAELEKRSKQA